MPEAEKQFGRVPERLKKVGLNLRKKEKIVNTEPNDNPKHKINAKWSSVRVLLAQVDANQACGGQSRSTFQGNEREECDSTECKALSPG